MTGAASGRGPCLSWALLLICFFLMPPPTPDPGLTPVNINYVWGLSDTAAQTWMPPYVWFAGLLVGLPLIAYAPAHFLLARFMPKAQLMHAPVRKSRAGFTARCVLPGANCAAACAASAVFIACIALGVMAIAGVGSVAASLTDGIGGAGQIILGGDLAFSLIQREASDAERAFLDATARCRWPPPCAPWRAPAAAK